MLVSFANKKTRDLSEGKRVKEFQPFERIALRKLRQLEVAHSLDDLSVPPGNRLEPLHGSRKGQHSIRINNRYRVCFVWSDVGAREVEIVDYH